MASELAPLPGDPVALKSKADALSTAAQQIQQAIDHLRKLADRGDTVSDAVDKVRSKASPVAASCITFSCKPDTVRIASRAIMTCSLARKDSRR